MFTNEIYKQFKENPETLLMEAVESFSELIQEICKSAKEQPNNVEEKLIDVYLIHKYLMMAYNINPMDILRRARAKETELDKKLMQKKEKQTEQIKQTKPKEEIFTKQKEEKIDKHIKTYVIENEEDLEKLLKEIFED